MLIISWSSDVIYDNASSASYVHVNCDALWRNFRLSDYLTFLSWIYFSHGSRWSFLTPIDANAPETDKETDRKLFSRQSLARPWFRASQSYWKFSRFTLLYGTKVIRRFTTPDNKNAMTQNLISWSKKNFPSTFSFSRLALFLLWQPLQGLVSCLRFISRVTWIVKGWLTKLSWVVETTFQFLFSLLLKTFFSYQIMETYGHSVGVLLSDLVAFSSALLEWMLFLVLKFHIFNLIFTCLPSGFILKYIFWFLRRRFRVMTCPACSENIAVCFQFDSFKTVPLKICWSALGASRTVSLLKLRPSDDPAQRRRLQGALRATKFWKQQQWHVKTWNEDMEWRHGMKTWWRIKE